MRDVIIVLNLFVSLISASGGIVALCRPTALLGAADADPGDFFYARLYCARAIPVGLAAGIVPFLLRGPGVASLLFVAAAIQVADASFAALQRNARLGIAASFAAIVYVLCGAALF